jgi:TRAP transporter TAXI family solute receptor
MALPGSGLSQGFGQRLRGLRVSSLSPRDLLVVVLPALLLLGAAFWFASKFIQPAPPSSLIMATGSPEGAYHQFAQRYREILARKGFDLQLRNTDGSAENLERLEAQTDWVDVAFVQGGLGEPAKHPDLVSLGGLYYEPLWVFYRSKATLERLSDLRGMRVAIGPEGSGSRPLALQLLAANGLLPAMVRMSPLSGNAAVQALLDRRLDAVMLIASPEAPFIARMLRDPELRLMSFSQADAYTKRFFFLSRVVLPRGAIDLVRDLPRQDTTLVAPTAQLVSRSDLHPTLQTLLLQAAAEVHGGPGLFQKAREFPSGREQDFPLSAEAERFHKGGLPFLQRFLPLWLAILIERLWVMLLPIVAVAIPLSRIVPPLYNWRIRRRILGLYAELRYLEYDIRNEFDPARVAEYQSRLDVLDVAASTRPIPLGFADQVYMLRQHINVARDALAQLAGRAKAAGAPGTDVPPSPE